MIKEEEESFNLDAPLKEDEVKESEELRQEEKDKHNALWVGVIFFMLLIVVLWIMNLGTVFKKAPLKNSDNLNIDKLTQDFKNSIDETGAKMGELKTISPTDLRKYPLQIPAATGTVKN